MQHNTTASTDSSLVSGVAEIAALPYPQKAIEQLADTLELPIAVVSNSYSAFSHRAKFMSDISKDQLRDVKNTVVAGHEEYATPSIRSLMWNYALGAVIPFYAQRENTTAWLLIGRRAGEDHSQPFDFSAIRGLFQQLGDECATNLNTMRKQAILIEDNMRALRQRIAELEIENHTLRNRREAGVLAESKLNTGEEGQQALLGALERGESLDSLLAKYESSVMKWAIKRCRGNKAKAARLLKVRANTFHYKVLRRNIADGA